MKNTQKLFGAALLVAVGVAVAIPNTTKAAPETDTKTGDGYVEFTRDTGKPAITKPGLTGSTITNMTGADENKQFGIIAVTPLDFKKHKILSDGSGREYPVKPFHANPGSTNPNYPEYQQANFVKYTDDRSTLDHKYKLSGKITSNFETTLANGDSAELKGASITFSDMSLKSIADPALRPAASALKAGPHELKAKNGTVEANSIDFVVNEDPTKGRGDYELVFGDADTANSAENAVKLKVPKETEIMYGKYKAVITWTLSDTL